MVSFYVIMFLVIKVRGLYIHIPFCKRLCSFCDFPKRINQKEEVINNYLDKLIKEINNLEETSIDTIYIGGGTPNSLSLEQLDNLLASIKNKGFNQICEYTIETNYELITLEQIKLFKKYNINRISIGVQTLNKEIANDINRYCNYDELEQKIKLLKENGITNINLDFIFGLPNETITDIRHNLKYIKKLDVSHISYYSLILEDKTVLSHKIEHNITVLPSDDTTADMYKIIVDELKKMGFHHYEISNFAKKGFESKHNMLYWNLDEYIGLGVSGASFYKNKRTYNSKLLINYMFDNDIIKEDSTLEILKGEYFWLGLRLIDGVSLTKYKNMFNSNPMKDFKIEELIEKGLLEINDDYLKLTELGLEHGNYVYAYFI